MLKIIKYDKYNYIDTKTTNSLLTSQTVIHLKLFYIFGKKQMNPYGKRQ